MDNSNELNIYNPNGKDDMYPFGYVLAKAVGNTMSDSLSEGNYIRNIEVLECLMGGREDEIYEDQMYMIEAKHEVLKEDNNISSSSTKRLYYDEKFKVINALIHRQTRGVMRVKEHLTQAEIVRLIVKNIKKDNQGQIIAITGAQGTGKSYTGIKIAQEVLKYTKPKRKFSLDNVIFSIPDFFNAYTNQDRTPEGDYILFEEIGVNASSKDSLSSINKILGKVSQTLRYRKLIIILTAPDLSFIDKTLRKQIHFWIKTENKFNDKKGYSTSKPHIVKNMQRTGDIHYIYPLNSDGNQVVELRVPKLEKGLAQIYEQKQRHYKDKLGMEAKEQISALEEKKVMQNTSLRNNAEFLKYCEYKENGMKTKDIIERQLIEKSQPTLSKWEKLRKSIKYED